MPQPIARCATTREAVRLLTRIPHGQPFNYSILDADGAAAVVEASPVATSVRDGRQLACTNHFQIATLGRYNRRNAGSHRRLPPLETWCRAELSISFKHHTGNNRVQRPLARRDVFE
ncbi:hypothetical protein JJC00_35425 [Bradyrhizobium diazoefficiens]|uniref:carcinine hydrolase/isopenicillin-N N-acyltransferase family protein n=1 Tax=Bradyrhizobium diazoefficiens TaxID=1355477 RepID=UPI00190E082F|nr:hypothetical protein JJC00_35425 [Bradyrhizobium diazoefficiens]